MILKNNSLLLNDFGGDPYIAMDGRLIRKKYRLTLATQKFNVQTRRNECIF